MCYSNRIISADRCAYDYARHYCFRPGGGMYSTVADITRFIAMQFRDQPANGGDQVLGSSTIREMQISPKGIFVGEPLKNFHGVLTGVPTFSGEAETLISDLGDER